MIDQKIVLLLLIGKIFVNGENDTSDDEFDKLFEGLSLSDQLGNLHNLTDFNKVKYNGFIENCLEYDPISIDISVNYLKIYFFVDEYIQSRKYYYQIKCYLRNLITTKKLVISEIKQETNKYITNINDCEFIKKIVGKSARNEIYFIIFGEPKECKNFVGIGTFVMLNPIKHGRPFPIKNDYFLNFKKSIINSVHSFFKNTSFFRKSSDKYDLENCFLFSCQKKDNSINFTDYDHNQNEKYNNGILVKDFEENYVSIGITSQFTQIYEVIHIMRDENEEWLNENSTISFLKFLIIFTISNYKHNIEIISEKSSEGTLKDLTGINDSNEYISWIASNAMSLIPITLIIGIGISCIIFFVQNKSNNIYNEEKKAVFKRGIHCLHEIKRNMVSDSDTKKETDSESVEN
ncbi:Hypothetical protein SRAE_1000092500 [Strongyloides ratti]|uniref:Uncharacterized protein n=1 Tax=Strongyloides ratti TaxID=34506 RepID=A0A090KYR9_STRRB|nr:Hypothetical protein SRAE_1000092500 [Strongyloides ratti]CEF62655.1 Hypothetical protein SRAE_1000092500 [Strongyloides ratti]